MFQKQEIIIRNGMNNGVQIIIIKYKFMRILSKNVRKYQWLLLINFRLIRLKENMFLSNIKRIILFIILMG